MESPARPLVAPAQDRWVTVLELVGVSLEQEGFRAAATTVATELATRLACERVSFGFRVRGRMRVEAISHSAEFDTRSNLARDLAAAMDEACDQDATVAYPPLAEDLPRVARVQQDLAQRHHRGAVWTVPLTSGGRVVGALTLERAGETTLDAESVRLAEEAAALLGPILALQRARDARPLERVRERVRGELEKLLGPRHATRKAVAVAAVLLFALLAFARADYRVVADATLEGRVQRAIVAGLDGYIAESNARAGDAVVEGQVLGRLDDRDLLLERRKWWGHREQLRREYREALAIHDRTQVNIVSAKLAQAEAELALAEEQLARTSLVAPFAGIVVQGDLSQLLGSPVEKGTVLFEIAPDEGYRIILEVDERDIADVAPGAAGRLALSAMPGDPLPLTVERITPVSIAEEGRNYFRVEARLERPVETLRPGMEGVAKIEAGRRPLLWIWTHRLVDWFRLQVWSWGL